MKSVTLGHMTGTGNSSIYHKTDAQISAEEQEIDAAKKDPRRFEPLYRRYHEQIYRYVYQRTDSADSAADITQQIFLKAMTRLGGYEHRGLPFASWLYRIAMSEVYQAFKDKKAERTVNVDTSTFAEILSEIKETPKADHRRELINAIASLKEDDVQLIELRYFEQRPFKEIAEILDITENNAKVRAHRTLERLKKAFDEKMKR